MWRGEGDPQQSPLVATLRHKERHLVKLHVGTHVDDDLSHAVAAVLLGKPCAHFLHGERHQFGGRIGLYRLTARAVFQCEALHHCPTPHVHVVHIGRALVLDQRQHVHIVYGGAHNHRARAELLYGAIFPLQFVGLLKFQFGSQLGHLLHEVVHHLLGVAFENLLHLLDVSPILLGCDEPLAASLAVLDVVLQAKSVLSRLDCFT